MSVIASKPCHEEENSRLTEEDDWKMQLAFCKSRHTTTIEGVNCITQTWRMKERVRVFPPVPTSFVAFTINYVLDLTRWFPKFIYVYLCFFFFSDENRERSSGFMFECWRRPTGHRQDATVRTSRVLDRYLFWFIYIPAIPAAIAIM